MNKPISALIIAALLASTSHAADVYRYRDNMPAAEMMLKLMDLFGVVERIPDPLVSQYLGPSYGTIPPNRKSSDQLNFLRYMQMVQRLQNPTSSTDPLREWTDPMHPQSSLLGMPPIHSMPPINPLGFTGMGLNPLLGETGTNPFAKRMDGTRGLTNTEHLNRKHPNTRIHTATPFTHHNMPASTLALPPHPSAPINPTDKIPGFFSNRDIAQITQTAKRDALNKSSQSLHQPQFSDGGAQETAVSTTALGMDGNWRNSGSEILMISKNRFIWEDGAGRDLSGFLKIRGNTMIASTPQSKDPLAFKFVLQGNRLSVINPGNKQAFHFIRSQH